jgi:CRISPR-associated protein (TIGR03986 family)
MIKAPYNFVPLAQTVVFPEWADLVSIDQPFEDGISGTINVKYTAQTPVFIGNGKGDEKENENVPIPNYTLANGKYAIPGSSLRGMLRNIMEIASFGKFSRVSNPILSVRDLQNGGLYTRHFTKEDNGAYEALSKAGWLEQNSESGEWFLYPVKYYRIEDSVLENLYKKDLRNKDSKKRIRKIANKVEVFFTANPVKVHKHHFMKKKQDNLKLKYAKVEKINFTQFSGAKPGFSVLTGSCGRKHMDFIFEDKKIDSIPVPKEIIRKFDDINIPDSANQKPGKALRNELSDYKKFGYPGLPVFYLTNKKNELFAIGLAQMFKLPYECNLHDAIKNSSELHFSDNMDFVECIFGKISNENNMSLRGRVQFEDAVTDSKLLSQQVTTVLSNPKPTYYPNYIQQDANSSKYKTLMDKDVTLRGWKRYPVRDTPNPLSVNSDQLKSASSFSPLQEGTVFSGKIHFHNLKKEELGLLLWAITWGNDNLLHSIGMGKPYGFGQIKADIKSLSFLKNNSSENIYQEASAEEKNEWIQDFENYMERKVVGWKKCKQLQELKAMADPKNADRPNWDLSHMSLQKSNNDFLVAKEKHRFLSSYTNDDQVSMLKKNDSRSNN